MIKPMTDEEAKRAIEKAKANRFDEYGNYGENNGRLNGELRREYGPAIGYANGYRVLVLGR